MVSVHIEVRPEYLVPDTNCFIDHLAQISVLASKPWWIMVPIVGKLIKHIFLFNETITWTII